METASMLVGLSQYIGLVILLACILYRLDRIQNAIEAKKPKEDEHAEPGG